MSVTLLSWCVYASHMFQARWRVRHYVRLCSQETRSCMWFFFWSAGCAHLSENGLGRRGRSRHKVDHGMTRVSLSVGAYTHVVYWLYIVPIAVLCHCKSFLTAILAKICTGPGRKIRVLLCVRSLCLTLLS